jgi:hypothetical protein
MSRLEEIEKAVAQLPPDELAKFREWFERFASDLFDAKIERDAKAGRLDPLAARAIAERNRGPVREI